jgi:putative flippase GtrA
MIKQATHNERQVFQRSQFHGEIKQSAQEATGTAVPFSDHPNQPMERSEAKVGKTKKKIERAELWQFLRFCVVGSLNAVIDFLVLNVLLWAYPTRDNWHVLGYNSVAVLLAATNSFFWNKYWTFQQRYAITLQEVIRFATVAGGTIIMNDLLMWQLARLFPGFMRSSLIGANTLKLGAIIGTMSISFFGMRLWVFFQKQYPGLTVRTRFSKRVPVGASTMPYGDDEQLPNGAVHDGEIQPSFFPILPASSLPPTKKDASIRRIKLQRL